MAGPPYPPLVLFDVFRRDDALVAAFLVLAAAFVAAAFLVVFLAARRGSGDTACTWSLGGDGGLGGLGGDGGLGGLGGDGGLGGLGWLGPGPVTGPVSTKVIPNALNTSLMWFANVVVVPPANNSPTALRVVRSMINDPESPAALNG